MGTPTAFFLAYTVCFALMHPIGIAIGLGVSQLSMNDAGYEGLNSTLQGDSQLSGVIQSNMVPKYSVIHLLVEDVSCVLLWGHARRLGPKQNTPNICHRQMNNSVCRCLARYGYFKRQ